MRYLGGKTRLAPYLLDIMLKHRKEGQLYWEPFCGGCNVIDKVEGWRAATDVNPYLIALWKALQIGYDPPKVVSEELYRDMQMNRHKYKKHSLGFVGFGASFGGKWFGGYARRRDKPRDYVGESRRTVLAQIEKMKNVKFSCIDALTITKIPEPTLVYCDPPYAGTTKYREGEMNSDRFWAWADQLVEKGHTVFVSELQAPKGWDKVFESSKFNGTYGDLTERLYAKIP